MEKPFQQYSGFEKIGGKKKLEFHQWEFQLLKPLKRTLFSVV
jgi:hypothetical protein